MIFECKHCGQQYCGECTVGEHFDWKSFCSMDCQKEFKEDQSDKEAERNDEKTSLEKFVD